MLVDKIEVSLSLEKNLHFEAIHKIHLRTFCVTMFLLYAKKGAQLDAHGKGGLGGVVV